MRWCSCFVSALTAHARLHVRGMVANNNYVKMSLRKKCHDLIQIAGTDIYNPYSNYCILNIVEFFSVLSICLIVTLIKLYSLSSGGGSGFVGRELTRLLKSKGHEITLISRQPGPGKITWVWFNLHLRYALKSTFT